MNKKIFKVIFILIIMFSFCTTCVLSSSDIDFNVQDPNNNSQTGESNMQDDPTDNSQATENLMDTPNAGTSSTEPETVQPSGISTSSESGLGVSGIINILLITVGVVLILLAIAIIIRLK